jgi:hypothetical protein
MAKKIKKELVKKSIQLAETKNGKKINKPIIEKIKKRGVIKGTKRGSYKKHSEFKESLKPQKVEITNNNLIDINELNNNDNIEIQTEENQIVKNEIENLGDDNYSKFLNEYGNPDLIEEKTFEENKTFDFTNNSNNTNTNSGNNINNNNPQLNTIKQNNSVLVNGYMLLALCDFIIPNVIIWIYGKIDERASQVKIANVKLDKDQKESLKESANACASYIFEQVNPMVIFFVGMFVMFATNIQSELSNIPKIKRIKKPIIKSENK